LRRPWNMSRSRIVRHPATTFEKLLESACSLGRNWSCFSTFLRGLSIKSDETVPEALRAWLDRAQVGGMSRLLRVQLGTRKDVEVLMPLIKAVTKQ